MTFQEQLNIYMEMAECGNRDLALAASLGTGSISRYRRGERTPAKDSIQMKSLSEGLARLLSERGILQTPEEILEKLRACVDDGILVEYDIYLKNLNTVLRALEVKNVDLARGLHMDSSLISRILSGQRRPSDIRVFTEDVVDYIARHYGNEDHLPTLCAVCGCSSDEIRKRQDFVHYLITWLGSSRTQASDQALRSFLTSLDQFDLNEFMRSIHFEEMKVPEIPFRLPAAKTYRGIPEMMQAELDFLRSAVLSRSVQDVILYSDMPIEEMSKDPDFLTKWMIGMALLLRKGLHLHNIHNVHRPMNEMILGLEGWIPMYMTGQISPYYLREQTDQIFHHFIRSAGTVAVTGEAIHGKQGNGRYIVSRNKKDVEYCRMRALDLLHNALPLMHIYRREQASLFELQQQKLWDSGQEYRMICSAPPLFTMKEDLLVRILRENRVSDNETDRILSYYHAQKARTEEIFPEISLHLEIADIAPKDWNSQPLRLALADLFPEEEICYTGQDYLEHLEDMAAYAADYPSVRITRDPHIAFRNMEILICFGKFVLVSKENLPTIHFMIHHPKLVRAFEQFIPEEL